MSMELSSQKFSCNEILKNEVLSLKKCADDLRVMLDDCRDTIEEETVCIQKEFLCEMDAIKIAKLSLEKKIYQLEKNNERLKTNANESQHELKQARLTIVELKSLISQKDHELSLHSSKITFLETKFENTYSENLKLKQENNEYKAKKLEAAEKIKFMQNEKEIFEKKLKISSEKRDKLELELHETKTSETFLQEQINELEEMTEHLREQMNKQHQYMVQKDIALKKDNKTCKHELKTENQKLKSKLKSTQDEQQQLEHQISGRRVNLDDANQNLRIAESNCLKLNMQLKSIENQLSLEKNTVDSLENKNRELFDENSLLKRTIENNSNVEKKEKSKSIEQKQTNEIENTLQKYFNRRLKVIEKSYNIEMEQKSNQVADLQVALKEKQDKILSLEIKLLGTTPGSLKTKY